MRFIDDQHRVQGVRKPDQFLNRRHIAVHTVDTLNRQPNLPRARPLGPLHGRCERFNIVVADLEAARMAGMDALLGAGVDQLIKDDRVVAAGERGEQGIVGEKAAGKVECLVTAEKSSGEGFQRRMAGLVTAQQPRASRADTAGPIERIPHRVYERGMAA